MINKERIIPQNLWYIIGLIATDGNLSLDGRHISITSKDISFLEDVRNVLGIKSLIGKKASGSTKEKIYGYLAFSDVSFYKFLNSIGLEKRKSLTIGELAIPVGYFNDFLRGVIDGDGCIFNWVHSTNKSEQWSLRIATGSYIFADWILRRTIEDFGVIGKIYKAQKRKNPLYTVKFGKVAAKIILTRCYYQKCLSLARKRDQAVKCIQSVNGWAKYNKMEAVKV